MTNLNEYDVVKLVKTDIINDKRDEPNFPKYTSQLINLANQNSQGTRPKNVGQLSELIQECPSNSCEGWSEWYMNQYHEKLDIATDKIWKHINYLKNAIPLITYDMVYEWVCDLVLIKTAKGLIFQEYILKYFANEKGVEYRLATPDEESKGIDGFIGNTPVQIKPVSYSSKEFLPET